MYNACIFKPSRKGHVFNERILAFVRLSSSLPSAGQVRGSSGASTAELNAVPALKAASSR